MEQLDGAEMQERVAEKESALDQLRQFLSTIDAASRDPDRWERAYFKKALDLLNAGAYGAVAPEVEYALEPPAKRCPKAQPQDDPELHRLNLAMMHRELDAAEVMPVTPYPPRFPYIRK